MSLTNRQKAEMALARTSDAIVHDSNSVREMRIARAALHMAAAMMERVSIDGVMWSGEFSIVEYFTTEVRKAWEAQEEKERLEDERRYLFSHYGLTWDPLCQRYNDGIITQPPGYIQRLLDKRKKEEEDVLEERRWLEQEYGIIWDSLRQEYSGGQYALPFNYIETLKYRRKKREEEQPMALAGPAPDKILLPTALATGEYIHIKITDQFGREVPVMECQLDTRPSPSLRYPDRHLDFSIKVSTYSDDPTVRAAEQALVLWITGLKPNDPRRQYIEDALHRPEHGIFLLYSHDMCKHIAVGVSEINVDTMPIRVLGMHYNSDARYSVMDAMQIALGENVSIYWITEKK